MISQKTTFELSMEIYLMSNYEIILLVIEKKLLAATILCDYCCEIMIIRKKNRVMYYVGGAIIKDVDFIERPKECELEHFF